MAFKFQRNLISFGRTVSGVKNWTIGWTVDEAERAASRASQSDAQQRPVPVTYGVLVGINHH